MRPWFQFDFRLYDIGETARPLIPGKFSRHIRNVLRMNQFVMRTHIVFQLAIISWRGLDTENGSKLKDLTDSGDHAVIDEILVTDDCFSNRFGEVLRSTILGDEIVCQHPAIVLETQFRRSEIFGCRADIVQKTAQVVYLGGILPVREMVFDNSLA